jgi:Family of unknown function (DUF5677)
MNYESTLPTMSRTKLQAHKQQGKKFLPPLHGYGNSSWTNERLPQMLWAALLIANLGREHALHIFRKAAKCFMTALPGNVYLDLTHYGLANLPTELAEAVLCAATADESARMVLSSLLTYDELPAKELWASKVGGVRVSNLQELIMRAVGNGFWHQTQEVTDCRWLRILPLVVTGRMGMPEKQFEQFVNYPNEGDMREVQPMIRCEELSMSGFEQHTGYSKKLEAWAKAFWAQNLRDSPCFPMLKEQLEPNLQSGTTLQRLNEVYRSLIEHAAATRTDTGVDARHDTAFGIGLYSLSIVRELLSIGNSNSIIGRLGLRTMLESYVTLAYLMQKGKPELWKSHRVFGAGQAKLSSLKLEELKAEKCFADAKVLKEIANEDIWEEFLPIDVGHWEGSNLRREAVEAGVKPDYDKYYAWTSTFAHSHWGSVREAVFEACGNPLHRLHRIPRESCKRLPDVIPDACQLADKTLGLVSRLYPEFSHRLSMGT